MQYFIGFVSAVNVETDNGCGGKLDNHLMASCQKYWYPKLLKSDRL